MSCGFGAVVLVFLIINHETNEQREFASDDVLSNNRQLDYQIQIENEKLEELKTVLSSLRKEASQIETEIEETSTKLGQAMIPATTMSGFDSTTARTTLNSATRILKEVIPEEDEKEKEEKEKEEEEEEEEENKEDQEELWKVARQRSTEKLISASFENKLADIDNILTSEENIINSAANSAEEERALHVCSSSKTVNFLIKRGADVQVRKRNKDQPLHVQCYAKNLKAIQYLLEAGADVNSRGDCGNSPLHLAASAAKIAQPKTRTGGNEMTSKNNS